MYENINPITLPPGTTGWNASDPVAVLPAGASINPRRPRESKNAPPYVDSLTLYVMYKLSERRTRPTRVLSSWSPMGGWHIGTRLWLAHDQTGAGMGEYMIVGVHHVASGEMGGDVPDISIKHAVLK